MSALSGVISPVSADNDIVICEISTLSEISSEISAPETLTGSLSILSPDDVTGELSGTAEITAELSGISTVDGELNVPRSLDVSYYSGDYDVIPKTDKEIILPTLGLCMTYDVTVHKVPYFEATNESGGYTVTIG